MTFRALAAMQAMRPYLAKRLGRADLARWDGEILALQQAMTWHLDLPKQGVNVQAMHQHWGPIVARWDGEVWVMTHNEHPIPRDSISAWAPLPDHVASLVSDVKRG